jgi:myo-inositol-1-phosphate synthase
MESVQKPLTSAGDSPLLVLIAGMGAVASTLIAGVELIRKKQKKPIGSLTQLGKFFWNGKPSPPLGEILPLTPLDQIVFGGWDLLYKSLSESAERSSVLSREDLENTLPFLNTVPVLKGFSRKGFLPDLPGSEKREEISAREIVSRIQEEIHTLQTRYQTSRSVLVLLLSTERSCPLSEIHTTLSKLEKGIEKDDPSLSPTILYTYSALKMGIPVINGTPNLSFDIPALMELAEEMGVPVAGKDLKSGQTLLKTALAPALRSRLLGVKGWFSTNILGNLDGWILNHPDHFQCKEKTKSAVLEGIFSPEDFPDLYKDLYHKVRIEYYPPKGDNKEGWDQIDLFGWLGYPMEIKVNFLCRDSILAAPLVLDLILFVEYAHRIGEKGPQEWLSFYFKDPVVSPGKKPIHHLFEQEKILYDQLRTYATLPQ